MDTDVKLKKSTTYRNLGKYGEFLNRCRISAWKAALEKISPVKKDWIVDMGCSYGSWVQNYRDLGFGKVLGLDSNPEVAERAEEACDRFISGDSSALSQVDVDFDVVGSNGVIIHILPDEDLVRFFREGGEALGPDGWFLFSGVNSRWWYSSGRENAQNDYFKVRKIDDYLRLADEANLEVVHQIGTYIDPWAAEALEYLALDEELRAGDAIYEVFESLSDLVRGGHSDPFTEMLFVAKRK